jgi:hypothetical protein
MGHNHLRNEGFVDQDQLGAILSEARTQSTHNKHTITYIKFKQDYYTLGSRIKYTKGV